MENKMKDLGIVVAFFCIAAMLIDLMQIVMECI